MVSGFATSPTSYAGSSWAFFMDGKACARVEIVAGPLTTLTALTARGMGSPHFVLLQGSPERLAARQNVEEVCLTLQSSLNAQGRNVSHSPSKRLCRRRLYGVPVSKGRVQ
jgi:hypothetical protein